MTKNLHRNFPNSSNRSSSTFVALLLPMFDKAAVLLLLLLCVKINLQCFNTTMFHTYLVTLSPMDYHLEIGNMRYQVSDKSLRKTKDKFEPFDTRKTFPSLFGMDGQPIFRHCRVNRSLDGRTFGIMESPIKFCLWDKNGHLMQEILLENNVTEYFPYTFEPHLLLNKSPHAILLYRFNKAYVLSLDGSKQMRMRILRLSSAKNCTDGIVDLVERHDGCVVGITLKCIICIWNIAKSVIPMQRFSIRLPMSRLFNLYAKNGPLRPRPQQLTLLPDGQLAIRTIAHTWIWDEDESLLGPFPGTHLMVGFTASDHKKFASHLSELAGPLILDLCCIIVAYVR